MLRTFVKDGYTVQVEQRKNKSFLRTMGVEILILPAYYHELTEYIYSLLADDYVELHNG